MSLLRKIGLVLIPWAGLGAIFATLTSGEYDLRLARWLIAHGDKGFARFMENSIFEGEPFGGGDPVLVLLVFVVLAYLLAWLPGSAPRLGAWRPQLGFILASSLICGFVMVHAVKLANGRARPSQVLSGRLPFSAWYESGPYLLLDGRFNGSFPSGHTAQSFIPMTLAYCLFFFPRASVRMRGAGCALGIATLGYAFAMAVSRVMNASHWPTDVCASILFSWIICHLLYHRLFLVSEQAAHFLAHGRNPPLPVMWEMRLCGLIVGGVLGAMAVITGLRAVVSGRSPLWLLLMLAGLIVTGYFCHRLGQRRAWLQAVLAPDGRRPPP